MKLLEKLLDYVSYETTADDTSSTCPSSSKELILASHLKDELIKYGCNDAFVDENGYVYGTLIGEENIPSLGLVAHMDTSPDASDKDVKTRIIENYDGKDIVLNSNIVTSVNKYPFLSKYKSKTLVVTDGTTLLGADDKAGIAIICEVLDTLNTNKDIKHGTIKVCFTPDEEIGRGPNLFNYDYFKVDYCYTVDGSDFDTIAYENFNASLAKVNIKGVSVHPGTAKDKMVNSINVAQEFHNQLDPSVRPEHTEGKEGFIHLESINGRIENTYMEYILRSFELDELNSYKEKMINISNDLNDKYGYSAVNVEFKEQYKNMKEVFNDNKKPIELFFNCLKKLGYTPKTEAIRGGTDGATFSLNGLPCPNIGTGGNNFHGPYEFWCKDDGEIVVKLLLEMINTLAHEY